MKEDRFLKVVNYYSKVFPIKGPDFNEKEAVHYWKMKFGTRTEAQIRNAFEDALDNQNRFPSPKEFLEYLGEGKLSNEDLGRDTATKLIASIKKYGWCNWKEAKENLDDLCLKIIKNEGGWGRVCELPEKDIIAKAAQIREQAKIEIKKKQFDISDTAPKLKSSRKDIEKTIRLISNNTLDIKNNNEAFNGEK